LTFRRSLPQTLYNEPPKAPKTTSSAHTTTTSSLSAVSKKTPTRSNSNYKTNFQAHSSIIDMGSTPSIPAPLAHMMTGVALATWIAGMVKLGCDKSHKCKREVELSMPPCNGVQATDHPCMWTTDTGEQFVSVPSVDVYVKHFQVVNVCRPRVRFSC
jgi:hypothetical protein